MKLFSDSLVKNSVCAAVFAMATLLIPPVAAQKNYIARDDQHWAIEGVERVSIALASADSGVLHIRCKGCPTKLLFNRNSQAFVNGEEVTMEQASNIKDALYSIIYQPKNKAVVRLDMIVAKQEDK